MEGQNTYPLAASRSQRISTNIIPKIPNGEIIHAIFSHDALILITIELQACWSESLIKLPSFSTETVSGIGDFQ
jgi:hypothetical protein